MSSRVARLWQPGQGRPRVFLPDFWIKLVETSQVGVRKLPPNASMFQVDMRMSRLDVREYLEKIYRLPVRDVRTYMVFGEVNWHWPNDIRNRRALWKEEDKKMALVFFRKGFRADIPNLFPENTDEQMEAQKERIQAGNQTPNAISEQFVNKDRAGVGRLLN